MNQTLELSRRDLGILGAGVVITVLAPDARAQVPLNRGRGGRGSFGPRGGGNVSARLHIAQDGTITVMTGKVECGQGARAQITQAAAEELRVVPSQIHLVMADTDLVPNDGPTAGSRTTPSTIPTVRQACAAARNLLVDSAAKQWKIDTSKLQVRDGKVIDPTGKQELTYAALAQQTAFDKPAANDVTVTAVKEWKTLGQSISRPNGRDIVTGQHAFPSDIRRPGMLYGKLLRPVSFGAKLTAIDENAVKFIEGAQLVRDGSFIGVVAPSTFSADAALDALSKTAKWDRPPHPSSNSLYDDLKKKARGGVPKNPNADEFAKAAKSLSATYHVPYVQHAPMEPRAAVAEWVDGKLTVWTASQNPFGVRGELTNQFKLANDKVRVIIPDFGGGFGGKHSGECAVEAARLAQLAKKPVCLRWTRSEEFTWAYFRPAGVIEAQASLDAQNNLATWHFVNINSGGSGIESPYRARGKSQTVQSDQPLRSGSYRGLASTANNFARECFIDELATLAGRDSLEFRLAHLENPRLKAVLEEAAKQFDFANRLKAKQSVGLACGTEKGSYVAACAHVVIEDGKIVVKQIVQAFECGAIMNPANLTAQNTGAIIMALGPALREEIRFENGQVTNDSFSEYEVPRMEDVPQISVHLIDRPDLQSSGAGETPLIATAPAIANAIYQAIGKRHRALPLRIE